MVSLAQVTWGRRKVITPHLRTYGQRPVWTQTRMGLFHLREQGFRNTKIKSASALLGLKRYEDPIKTQQEVYTPWTNPSPRRKFKQRATVILHWDDSAFKPHCPLAASLSLIPVSSDDNNPWTQRLTECMGWADVCADTQRTEACGSKGNMCLRKWLLRAALQGRQASWAGGQRGWREDDWRGPQDWIWQAKSTIT